MLLLRYHHSHSASNLPQYHKLLSGIPTLQSWVPSPPKQLVTADAGVLWTQKQNAQEGKLNQTKNEPLLWPMKHVKISNNMK